MSERTRIALFTGFFPPAFKAGGAIRSTANIVANAPASSEVLVVTGDRDKGENQPFDREVGHVLPYGRHSVLYTNLRDLRQVTHMARVVREFDPHIVYVNSYWSPYFSMLPAALAAARVWSPRMFLIAPRGELSPSALGLKEMKKRAVEPLWRAVRSPLPVWWHATDREEAEDAVAHGADARRVLTAMDPVDLPAKPATTTQHEAGTPLFIVAGRISPIKNLHTLLDGVATARAQVIVHFHGVVDDEAYFLDLQRRASGAASRIVFRGPTPHHELLEAMRSASGMLLPTLHENFGHVVPEALSQSCPVYAGPVTPFTEVIANGGGEVVDNTSPTAWAELIDRLAAEPAAQRRTRHDQAGAAYTGWRAARDESNILELALRACARS